MSLSIENLADQGRFQTVVDGHMAFAQYTLAKGLLTIVHTEVPAELGGRGIAGELVKSMLEYAREQGAKVRPACSYATAYLERHPEYSSLIA
jgi:predicted GNAT family acetyltransferase